MFISVIGTGYVGLVTGAVFADFGHQVTCVDIIEEKIIALNNSQIPFYEPGLKDLVTKNIQEGRLKFTTSYKEAVPNSEIIFVCVGTPSNVDGTPNLEY